MGTVVDIAPRLKGADIRGAGAGVRYWFWLSYTQHKEFVCVVLIEAEDFLDACARSRMRGFAPGTRKEGVEVLGWKLEGNIEPMPEITNRRLSHDQVMAVIAATDLGQVAEAERWGRLVEEYEPDGD